MLTTRHADAADSHRAATLVRLLRELEEATADENVWLRLRVDGNLAWDLRRVCVQLTAGIASLSAAVGEAKGVDGADALDAFFIKPASKIFLGRARIGRNCRCLTHIDAAVGHGRRRRRPLQRPRRHGPRTARYTRGNEDHLDVTLTRHLHSRRSSHPRV